MQLSIYFKMAEHRNVDYLKKEIQTFINRFIIDINQKGIEIPLLSVLTNEDIPYSVDKKHFIGFFISAYDQKPIILQFYFHTLIFLAKHLSETINVDNIDVNPVYINDMIYFPTADKDVLSDAKSYPNFIDEDRFSEESSRFPFIQRLLKKIDGEDFDADVNIIKEELVINFNQSNL